MYLHDISPDDMTYRDSIVGAFEVEAAYLQAECKTEMDVPRLPLKAPVRPEFQLRFDDNKAGLDKVDKKTTEAVIEEASRGSAFYINERRKEESRQRHVQLLRQRSAQFSQCLEGEENTSRRRKWETKLSQIEEELEAMRHFGNFVHVDMDMFYAAVEMKKNPLLASVPLGVGSASMLSTTNYIARRYGVRSGMPGFIGKKLCPTLVIVPTDFDAYRAEAAVVRRIAAECDPNFTSVGLDELTMEVTAYMQQHGMTAADVAEEFRARVFAETQLTASAGIAPTATLAKIASNYKKPNGQHELLLRTRQEVIEFVRDLPVRTVPGIGRSAEVILHGLGIQSLGDIYKRRLELCYVLTEKTFAFYFGASIGVMRWFDGITSSRKENADAMVEVGRKSIGREETFNLLHSRLELQEIAQSNLQAIHKKLVGEGIVCRQVVLKIKRTTFQVQQFSKNLVQHVDSVDILRRALDELLLPILDQYSLLRLLGVRLTDLMTKRESEAHQKQRGGGFQRSLFQYCIQNNLGSNAKKRRRGEKDEANVIFIEHSSSSSEEEEEVRNDDDDVICVTPPVKPHQCLENIIVID